MKISDSKLSCIMDHPIHNNNNTNDHNDSFHSDADESLADDDDDGTSIRKPPRSENSVGTNDDLAKGSLSTTNDNNTNNNNDPNSNGISSSAETLKEVRQIKIIIVLVLLVSIAGAISVFFYTKYSEQNEFEVQFENDANKVRSIVLFHLVFLSVFALRC